MAFTASLTDPDTRAFDSGISASRSGGGSELASLISGGMQVFETIQRREAVDAEKQERLAKEQAVLQQDREQNELLTSSYLTSIEAQDKILRESQEGAVLKQEIHDLYADGLTASERELLAEKTERMRRLSLLDPKNRQLYINAERKKALADPRAYGIQAEVDKIFTGISSETTALMKTPELPAEVKDTLINWYGDKEYTEAEKATVTGYMAFKKMKTEQLVTRFSESANNSEGFALMEIQDTFQKAALKVNSQGAMTPEDKDLILNDLRVKQQRMQQQYQQLRGAFIDKGHADKIPQLDEMWKRVDKVYTDAFGMFQGDGQFGEGVNLRKRLNDQLEVMKLAQQNQVFGKVGAAVFSDGNGSGGGSLSNLQGVLELLNANEKVLREALPPHLRGDVDKAKSDMAIAALELVKSTRTKQDLLNKGAISSRLDAFVGANYGYPTAQGDPKKVQNLTENMNLFMENGTISVKENIQSYMKNASTIQEKPTAQTTEFVRTGALAFAENIKTRLHASGLNERHWTFDQFGNVNLHIGLEDSKKYNQQAINDIARDMQLFNEFTTKFSSMLGGKERTAQLFYKKAFDKDQPQEDSSSKEY